MKALKDRRYYLDKNYAKQVREQSSLEYYMHQITSTQLWNK